MKGTLVKRKDRWDLYNKSGGSKIASTAPNPQCKLSIINCESIENGYDINQLAAEVYRDFPNKANGGEPLPIWGKDEHAVKKRKAFIKGFNAAVEILGDKKFSRDDMLRASDWYVDTKGKKSIDELIESLQQKEWLVEVEMEETGIQLSPDATSIQDSSYAVVTRKPKLDSEGCLILKRKS